MPSTLTPDEMDHAEDFITGWGASHQPTPQTLARLRQLCPTDNSWGETEEFVTKDEWGSDLRIWWEQGRVWSVKFRFSPVTDEHALLDRFVAIARDEDCLLLDGNTGALFEPDDALVARHLSESRAVRFMRDPQAAIVEAGKATPQ